MVCLLQTRHLLQPEKTEAHNLRVARMPFGPGQRPRLQLIGANRSVMFVKITGADLGLFQLFQYSLRVGGEVGTEFQFERAL